MRQGVLAGGLGLAATLLALALVLVPGAVRSIAPLDSAVAAVESTDSRTLMLAVGLLAGLITTAVARTRRSDQTAASRPRPLVERPPEVVTSGYRARPGESLDQQVEHAVAGESAAGDQVRETLRAAAIRRLARDPSVDSGTAERTVQRGEWTDDELAAAFLGSWQPSVGARLREWLDPEAERRRRIDRTLTAIERIGGRER